MNVYWSYSVIYIYFISVNKISVSGFVLWLLWDLEKIDCKEINNRFVDKCEFYLMCMICFLLDWIKKELLRIEGDFFNFY